MRTPENRFDEDDVCLWNIHKEVIDRCTAAINASPINDVIHRALKLLHNRTVNALTSLQILCAHSRHNFHADAGSILRTMFDISVQAEYMMIDSTLAHDRAQMFLDFYWVQKRGFMQRALACQGRLSEQLSQSRRRSEAEPVIEAEFKRVMKHFTNDRGKVRSTWYPGTLADLSRAIGRYGEYAIYQPLLSGAVHAGPYILSHPFPIRDTYFLMHGYTFAMRVLRLIVQHHKITLSSFDADVINSVADSSIN